MERKGVFVLPKLPVRSKPEAGATRHNNSQTESFVWNNNFKKVLPNENLQQVGLAIDDGFPDVRLAPVDLLMREYRSLSRRYHGKNFLKYSTALGSAHLRLALQRYLANSRGLVVSPENILVTKGSQMGIYLAARLLLNPDDHIAVGLSNYGSADDTFRHTGARLLRIPVDDHGMVVDDLETALLQKKLRRFILFRIITFPPQ